MFSVKLQGSKEQRKQMLVRFIEWTMAPILLKFKKTFPSHNRYGACFLPEIFLNTETKKFNFLLKNLLNLNDGLIALSFKLRIDHFAPCRPHQCSKGKQNDSSQLERQCRLSSLKTFVWSFKACKPLTMRCLAYSANHWNADTNAVLFCHPIDKNPMFYTSRVRIAVINTVYFPRR